MPVPTTGPLCPPVCPASRASIKTSMWTFPWSSRRQSRGSTISGCVSISDHCTTVIWAVLDCPVCSSARGDAAGQPVRRHLFPVRRLGWRQHLRAVPGLVRLLHPALVPLLVPPRLQSIQIRLQLQLHGLLPNLLRAVLLLRSHGPRN